MKFYDLSEDDLAKKIQTTWKKAWEDQSNWREQAKEDFNFVASHQWNEEDLKKLTAEGRPIVTFNRCNAILAAILGMEANQRQETKFTPRENSDTALSDALSSVVDWVRAYADIEQEEAVCFEDMLTCGLGWTGTRTDYEVDLDGKVLQERIYPLEMCYDPSARKKNLEDAEWVCRSRRMSIEDIQERWPKAENFITDSVITSEDDSDEFMHVASPPSEAYNFLDSKTGEASKSKATVLQFQWYETVPVYRTINEMTQQFIKLTEEQHKKLKPVLEARGIKVIKQRERKYYQAFVVGSTLLEKTDNPCQTGFSFKAMTGKLDHVHKQFYGIVRLMKDPQRWANKFFSQFLDIVDSNAKGGLIAETGAVSDVQKFESEWSRADSVTWVNPGAIAQKKIIPRPTAQYPNAVDRLMTFAISSIYEVTGVNLELLGMVDRAQPGVVEESRKRSAYTILAPYFDSLRAYRKSAGMILLEYIQKYIPAMKIAEVLEQAYKPLAQVIKQIDLKQINVAVSESPQSDNNKMVVWQFISQVVPQLLRAGLPMPPDILEYSPLPAALVEKWKQMIEKQEQDQERQMAKMLAMKKEATDISHKESKSRLADAQANHEMASAQQKAVEIMFGKNIYGER
jgi:hypothetical protein